MKPDISYEDFQKLDIRIGKIIEARIKEGSEKLLRFVVDFGSEIGQRVIFSGIRKYYQPEEFNGKIYPFVINMPAKKMLDEESQGMMLLVDDEKPVPIMPCEDVLLGAVVR
jgi:methionyl-tRNA synthetase